MVAKILRRHTICGAKAQACNGPWQFFSMLLCSISASCIVFVYHMHHIRPITNVTRV